MNCPKCGKQMSEFTGNSSISSSARLDGASAQVINGYSCFICGKWLEKELEVLKPIPKNAFLKYVPKSAAGVKGLTSKAYSLQLRETIRQAYPEIRKRQLNETIKDIAADFKMAYSTFLAHFRVICNEHKEPTNLRPQRSKAWPLNATNQNVQNTQKMSRFVSRRAVSRGLVCTP